MKYSYEITRVDEAARVMDVLYSHDVHGQMLVGVRLPFEGEDLTRVVHEFSPVPHWQQLEAKVAVPEVGITGSIDDNFQAQAASASAVGGVQL